MLRIGILLGSVIFALLCALAATPAPGDSLLLAWSVNSCGAERMREDNLNLIATVNVGQITIGENGSGPRMAHLGVLSAEQSPPTLVASPGPAKLYPDGARLALAGLVVTTDFGSFSDRVYAEAPDRSSGIALVNGVGETADAREGSRVNVVGGLSTLDGERVMLQPMITVQSSGDPLSALGMTNGYVGGTDFGAPPSGQRGVLGGIGLNNVGLLIRTTGMVIDNTIPQYILINDGSKEPFWDTGLRVAKTNLSPVPEIGSYVAVSGISSVSVRGSSILDAILRPRKPGDLQVLMPPAP